MRNSVLFCSLLLGSLCFARPLQAADIAWISFHTNADMASAAAMGATPPHTVAPDKAYTDLLMASGHTVTRFLTMDTPDTAALNSFDLVIISRSVNSGHYETDAETARWAGITAPVMILGGYTLRANRLGFTTGNTIPDSTGPISLTVNDPGHPIFAGIPLDATNTMVNPYADIVTFGGDVQRGVSVNTNPVAGGGTVLATVGTAGDPTFGGMIIGQWGPGAMMGNSPPDTLAGHRLVFLTGTREAAGDSSETAGLFDLSPNGQTMFVNAANFMIAIPEPSTFALCGIALAGLGLLRWKTRRSAA
ncbi:MAG: hypothetical protein WD894_18720 [Pirellulales bacterium]